MQYMLVCPAHLPVTRENCRIDRVLPRFRSEEQLQVLVRFESDEPLPDLWNNWEWLEQIGVLREMALLLVNKTSEAS